MKYYITWFILQASLLGTYLYNGVSHPDEELVFRTALVSSFVTVWCIGLFLMTRFIYGRFLNCNKI